MKSAKPKSPPKLATSILKWFCKPDLLEDVEGDIAELYTDRVTTGKKQAGLRDFMDVILLFRPGIIKEIGIKNGLINTAMLKNYLKIALRNALRYIGFTALNLI